MQSTATAHRDTTTPRSVADIWSATADAIRTAPPAPPPAVARSPLSARAPARVLLRQLRRKEWGPVLGDAWRVCVAILGELETVVDYAGRAVMTEAELGGRAGYSVRHVRRGVRALESLGLIRFTPGRVNPVDGRRTPSVWQLVKVAVYAAWRAARGGYDQLTADRRAAAAARTRRLWGPDRCVTPSRTVPDIVSAPTLPSVGTAPTTGPPTSPSPGYLAATAARRAAALQAGRQSGRGVGVGS
jgi:hypothetical protein